MSEDIVTDDDRRSPSDLAVKRGRRFCILSLVAVAFGVLTIKAGGTYVYAGGAYETRTLFAMILRTLVWAVIATFAWRSILRQGQ